MYTHIGVGGAKIKEINALQFSQNSIKLHKQILQVLNKTEFPKGIDPQSNLTNNKNKRSLISLIKDKHQQVTDQTAEIKEKVEEQQKLIKNFILKKGGMEKSLQQKHQDNSDLAKKVHQSLAGTGPRKGFTFIDKM